MAKAVSRYIAERTDNGYAIVDRLIELGLEAPATSAADRRIAIAACAVLLERGAGKPPQEVAVAVADARPAGTKLRRFTDAELELLARLDEAEPTSGLVGELYTASPELRAATDALDAMADSPAQLPASGALVLDVASE